MFRRMTRPWQLSLAEWASKKNPHRRPDWTPTNFPLDGLDDGAILFLVNDAKI